MTFQVPQFIDTEDKIIGPLTLKQFAYIAVAFLASVGAFYVFSFFLWLVVSVLLWSLAIGLALTKISGRPLPLVLMSAFKFYWQPRLIMWRHEIPEPVKIEEAVSRLKFHPTKLKEKKITIPKIKFQLPAITVTKKPVFAPSPITTGADLKDLSEKLMTTKNVIANREKDSSFFRRQKERYSIIEKFTGERLAAKRIDYR